MTDKIRLNLGGADRKIDGFINIDRMHGQEVYPLAYEDNSVDEMRASHILEHFGWHELKKVLQNWVDKLKPGGMIKIGVPDFGKIIKMYEDNSDPKVGFYLFGGQTDANDYHKSAFDTNTLKRLMEECGLTDVKEFKDDVFDDCSLEVSLNLQGTKGESSQKSLVERKIVAVMTMPRLTFTDTMNCVTRLVAKGIPLKKSTGVFWGQCLTRMFQEEIKKDTDYILAIDYDSYFTYKNVIDLVQLLENHPDYDAVMPIQIKRENETPLLGIKHPDNSEAKYISMDYFDGKDIVPAFTGHFGLTVFRKSCFLKIKKPWFLPKPDENGEWGDGRKDEDIVFWHNFAEGGCKLGLACNIRIGHLQLQATYPGRLEDAWKPVHLNINDVENGKVPEWLK